MFPWPIRTSELLVFHCLSLLVELHVPENKHLCKTCKHNVMNAAMHQPAHQHPVWDSSCRGGAWPSLLPVMSLINHMIRRDLCFFMDDDSRDGQLRMLSSRLAECCRQSLQERHEGQNLIQVRINPGWTSSRPGYVFTLFWNMEIELPVFVPHFLLIVSINTTNQFNQRV